MGPLHAQCIGLLKWTREVPPELVSVKGAGLLVPEVGHSAATTEQKAIQEIAQRIVGMMEAPW